MAADGAEWPGVSGGLLAECPWMRQPAYHDRDESVAACGLPAPVLALVLDYDAESGHRRHRGVLAALTALRYETRGWMRAMAVLLHAAAARLQATDVGITHADGDQCDVVMCNGGTHVFAADRRGRLTEWRYDHPVSRETSSTRYWFTQFRGQAFVNLRWLPVD